MDNIEIIEILKDMRNVICDMEKLPGNPKPYALLERVVLSLCMDIDNIIGDLEKRDIGL